MFVAAPCLGAPWQNYSEVVTQRLGRGRYKIKLRKEGLGRLGRRGLGAAVNTAGLVSTGAAVATTTAISSLAAGSAIGAWAGPIGAGVGALVGIIAGLWSAHDARVKGAKEENQIAGSAVQTWDSGMQAIFQAANSGSVTGPEAAQVASQLLSQFWAAVAQAKGLPGVADNSNYGGSCGTYTPGVTQRCSPGKPCNKSCTAGCCVGCNDIWPSTLDAISVLSNPNGGSFTTCTVYASSYGLAQRAGYNLTYTPPSGSTGTAASALGLSGSTIGGIPSWLLLALGLGAFAVYKFA